MEASPQHGPSVEFQSQERVELITKLNALLGELKISSITWACLWLSDIETLQRSVDGLGLEGNPLKMALESLLLAGDFGRIVLQWSQRDRSRSATPTSPQQSPTARISPGEPSTPRTQQSPRFPVQTSLGQSPTTSPSKKRRSAVASRKCRERDQFRCVVTKYYDPIDVAHIFPFSLDHTDNLFWKLLHTFWSQEHVAAWKNAVMPHGTEVVKNLISFAPHVHRWHGRSFFGLEPIYLSNDRKQLKLKFYWLPQQPKRPLVDILEIPTIPSDLEGLENDFVAWNVKTKERIFSGEEILMETSDPEGHPLPDWHLLEMQWVLQRLSALSGAADVSNLTYDDDDEDELYRDHLSLDDDDQEDKSSVKTSLPSSVSSPRIQLATVQTTISNNESANTDIIPTS